MTMTTRARGDEPPAGPDLERAFETAFQRLEHAIARDLPTQAIHAQIDRLWDAVAPAYRS